MYLFQISLVNFVYYIMPPEEVSKKQLTKNEKRVLQRAQRSEEEKEKDRKADRERKAKKRSEQSEEQKEKEREEARERMAKNRSQLTDVEKESIREKDRKAKAMHRESQSEDTSSTKYTDHEREFNRLYKVKMREGQTNAAHEYEIINNLLCMRKLRNSRDGKDHLLDNLKAKRGMQLIKEVGFARTFQNRAFREIDEIVLWKYFVWRGKEFSDILSAKKPDMATKVLGIIEEQNRKYDELKAEEKKREDEGIWWMNPADEAYYWTGKNPPGPDNPHPDKRAPEIMGYEAPTPEDDLEWDKLYHKWSRELSEEQRNERNRVARENYHKRKAELEAELKKPIEVPDFELSEYEKIREQNIKERNEALKAAGFDKAAKL